eukprot:gene19858-21798_t
MIFEDEIAFMKYKAHYVIPAGDATAADISPDFSMLSMLVARILLAFMGRIELFRQIPKQPQLNPSVLLRHDNIPSAVVFVKGINSRVMSEKQIVLELTGTFLNDINKFKAAIIFLVVLSVIVGTLVGVYFILKKDLCHCNEKKEDVEDVEDVEVNVEDNDENEEKNLELESEQPPEEYSANNEETVLKKNKVGFILETGEGSEHENTIPEVIVTESSFSPEKPKRGSSIKSVFKKITKPIGKVRFSSLGSRKSRSEDIPLVGGDQDGYGALTAGKRTDSMESFLSGISVVSENIEEFGEEVSPGRLQTSLEYDKSNWIVKIAVKQGQCLIHTGHDKIYWQVHIALLPFKKHRYKTKYKSTATPVFNQSFEIEDVAEQALGQIAIRLRVYGKVGHSGRKKLAGETTIALSCLQKGQGPVTDWHVLKRRHHK